MDGTVGRGLESHIGSLCDSDFFLPSSSVAARPVMPPRIRPEETGHPGFQLFQSPSAGFQWKTPSHLPLEPPASPAGVRKGQVRKVEGQEGTYSPRPTPHTSFLPYLTSHAHKITPHFSSEWTLLWLVWLLRA